MSLDYQLFDGTQAPSSQGSTAERSNLFKAIPVDPDLQKSLIEKLDRLTEPEWRLDTRPIFLPDEGLGRCIVFGATKSRVTPKPFLASGSENYPEIQAMLLDLIKPYLQFDPGFKFSSVYVLKDTEVPKHIGHGVASPAVFCSLGSFKGGELLFEVPNDIPPQGQTTQKAAGTHLQQHIHVKGHQDSKHK